MSNKIIPHPKTLNLPRARGSGFMHLTLCFSPSGEVSFYPDADDPQKLAISLAKIVDMLYENPELIVHAAGACGGEGVEWRL